MNESNGKFASINLNEDKIIIVKNKEIKEITAPPSGHGETELIWRNGKVDRLQNRFTEKI